MISVPFKNKVDARAFEEALAKNTGGVEYCSSEEYNERGKRVSVNVFMTGKEMDDTEMLDRLQDEEPGLWIARRSESGRGFRLHNTTREDAKPTIREAIIAYFENGE